MGNNWKAQEIEYDFDQFEKLAALPVYGGTGLASWFLYDFVHRRQEVEAKKLLVIPSLVFWNEIWTMRRHSTLKWLAEGKRLADWVNFKNW